MQFYDITIGTNGMQEVGVAGRYVYYVEGTTPNITAGVPGSDGNESISIQAAGSGLNVILKPGQSIRLADDSPKPNAWRVTNAKKLEVITGKIVIGDGEFRDANIKNTVKLDLTSANQVTVQNASLATTVTNEVEVKNDAGNPLNIAVTGTPAVTISGTATVQENLVSITGGVTHIATAANASTDVFLAAENVNGAIIQSVQGLFTNAGGGNSGVVVIAKAAGNPASFTDGMTIAGGIVKINVSGTIDLKSKLKIPAGWGVKIFNGGSAIEAVQLGATFTLL